MSFIFLRLCFFFENYVISCVVFYLECVLPYTITNGPLSSFSRSSSDCNRDDTEMSTVRKCTRHYHSRISKLHRCSEILLLYLLLIYWTLSCLFPLGDLLKDWVFGKQMFSTCCFEWKVCSATSRWDHTSNVFKRSWKETVRWFPCRTWSLMQKI